MLKRLSEETVSMHLLIKKVNQEKQSRSHLRRSLNLNFYGQGASRRDGYISVRLDQPSIFATNEVAAIAEDVFSEDQTNIDTTLN